MDPNGPLYCSFCGKDKPEVRKLIMGGGPGQALGRTPRILPIVCICDQCIELCSQIIAPENEPPNGDG